MKKDLSSIAEKTEEVLASPQQSSSAPTLRSELDLTLKKMEHVYGLSTVYLDKLVLKHTLTDSNKHWLLVPPISIQVAEHRLVPFSS